jgi:cyanate permease
MRTPIYLIIGAAFMGMGIAVWIGILFPGLPKAGYLRLMIGLVFVLMGVYRCALAFHSGPPKRPSHRSGVDSLP